MFDMLAARRRIMMMMAKKKPSFHVWDGSRDYSFLTSDDTLYIDTPEKFAGLMAVTRNFAQYDNRPDLVNAHVSLNGKTVKLTKDLYFNEDYEDSDNFVVGDNKAAQNGGLDSDRDLSHHNLAYTTFGDGIVRSLHLSVSRFVFDGQYHSLVGLYSNLSNQTVNMPNEDPTNHLIIIQKVIRSVVAKNFTLKHCVMKNGMSSSTGYDKGVKLIWAPISDNPNTMDIINVSAKSCTVCGASFYSNSKISRQILLEIDNRSSSNVKPNVRNINTQECKAYLNDTTSSYHYRIGGLVISGMVSSWPLIAATSDYLFSIGCDVVYEKGIMTDVVDNRLSPISSHIYTFGNTGYIDESNNHDNLQTMPSKAALIEQVNADITANGSGDLSLLDADGNFTGVCP